MRCQWVVSGVGEGNCQYSEGRDVSGGREWSGGEVRVLCG